MLHIFVKTDCIIKGFVEAGLKLNWNKIKIISINLINVIFFLSKYQYILHVFIQSFKYQS